VSGGRKPYRRKTLCLREPARLKPKAPGFPVQLAIHVQRDDRGSPGRSASDDCLSVVRPPKVFFPNLSARVEETDLNFAPGSVPTVFSPLAKLHVAHASARLRIASEPP
jgi:hypothetical protein